MNDYVKIVEDYFEEHYSKHTGIAQQWVLRKENNTIRMISEMAVKALEEHLK